MTLNLGIEICGTLLGVLYVILEYKADANVWIVGIIMPLLSSWVYFNAGLYADFAIAIYYFLAAGYGYYAWTHGRGKKNTRPITRITGNIVLVSTAAAAVLWVAIYFILAKLTNSTVPVCDAFTTALSIVGMWLMARKYAEQWVVWIVVDAVSCALYVYKGIPFYGGLYGLYTIVACFGYRKWLRMMTESA